MNNSFSDLKPSNFKTFIHRNSNFTLFKKSGLDVKNPGDKPVLFVSLRCMDRPERTMRIINDICNQEIDGSFLVRIVISLDGSKKRYHKKDNSKQFRYIPVNIFTELSLHYKLKKVSVDEKVQIEKFEENVGGLCGTNLINRHIELAQKYNDDYILFLSNDDQIRINHFQNYMDGIRSSKLGSDYYDFVFFNSILDLRPTPSIRESGLQHGNIGHAELIVKVDLLKHIEPHKPVYGHDWTFVQSLLKNTTKWKKCVDAEPTYIVKSVPGNIEPNID